MASEQSAIACESPVLAIDFRSRNARPGCVDLPASQPFQYITAVSRRDEVKEFPGTFSGSQPCKAPIVHFR